MRNVKNPCHAPRCIGKLEGERIFTSPKTDPKRFRVWEEFIDGNPKKRKTIYLCSKHFERKYLSFCQGEVVRLLTGARAIPTIHCQGPDMQVGSNEVFSEDSNPPTSDIIVRGLNEAVRLTPKFEVEDDTEEVFQDEIPFNRYEPVLDVSQSNTQRIVKYSESLQDVSQCNIRIERLSDQDPYHVIEEHSEMYSLITLPYLEKANLNLQWVYKILCREEGCERIVYECPNKDDKNGFMLVRDSRWDGINLGNLHLIAIAYRPGIMSLRDLRMKHLRLLQNIYSDGKNVIMKKYGVAGTQLCIFIQYAPSFYHLHVHFTAMNDDVCRPDFGSIHPLYLVIHNIQMFPTYYQVTPLSLCLKESEELFKEFEARGIVARILPSS